MGYYDNYLEHHGVLGMKWGVRRFQNKDGTLTEAGRKRHQSQNFKEISKSYKKTRDTSMPYKTDDNTKNLIRSKVSKFITNEDTNKVNSLKQKWLELENKYPDFFDSKACEEATKKAYQDTLDYFKKNEPEYLNEIIAKNNGDTSGLDMFHDFRKVNEGFEDEYWSKAEKEWNKSEEGRNRKLADKAWEDYFRTSCDLGRKYSDEILGDYGNKKLSAFGDETYSELVTEYAIDAIKEYSKQKVS